MCKASGHVVKDVFVDCCHNRPKRDKRPVSPGAVVVVSLQAVHMFKQIWETLKLCLKGMMQFDVRSMAWCHLCISLHRHGQCCFFFYSLKASKLSH